TPNYLLKHGIGTRRGRGAIPAARDISLAIPSQGISFVTHSAAYPQRRFRVLYSPVCPVRSLDCFRNRLQHALHTSVAKASASSEFFSACSLRACARMRGHRCRATTPNSLISSLGPAVGETNLERTHSGPNSRLDIWEDLTPTDN